jgi:CspA family cold shock protein
MLKACLVVRKRVSEHPFTRHLANRRAGDNRQSGQGGLRRMSEGTVKWFNDAKGFGFLSQDGGPDVFVHHSEIRSEGFRSLTEGDRVRFEVVQSPKGPRAANVTRI